MAKKLLTLAIIAITAGVIPLTSVSKAEAQTIRRTRINRDIRDDRDYLRNSYSRRNITNNRFFDRRHDRRDYNRIFRTNRVFRHNYPIRILSNRDFFVRHRLFDRFPVFRTSFPGILSPREFIIVDRDNRDNYIRIQNSLSGPFSINRAYVTVDRNFYNRFISDFEYNQDVEVSVDTGNNIVRFNTIAGDISTGDVDISIE